MLPLFVCALCLLSASAVAPSPDTLAIPRLSIAPGLDGRADEREYGAVTLHLDTAAGDVRVWLGWHGGFIYVAAALPDSTFYWGDDFVVSLDPDGSGGARPEDGDRQWYLRRVLDSSFVALAENGWWYPPRHAPSMLGSTRHHPDWDVASSSSAAGWIVELRMRAAVVKPGVAAPGIAFRTYNDQPAGWWSWPAAPPGVPSQRVEQSPASWVSLRLS